MIQKDIIYFRKPCVLACDAKCDKAWGINLRPRNQLSDDEDDYEFLSDTELGTAPIDPGTWEGGFGKPVTDDERLNKWCARECERSVIADPGEKIVLTDFSRRLPNKFSRRV